MTEFKEKMEQMSKPEIEELKHRDLLSSVIIKSKDTSVLSSWWLGIPVYLVAAFVMKSCFMPHTTLLSNIDGFTEQNKLVSFFIFIAIPITFIIINLIITKNIFSLFAKIASFHFFKVIRFNLLIIAASLLLMLLYSL